LAIKHVWKVVDMDACSVEGCGRSVWAAGMWANKGGPRGNARLTEAQIEAIIKDSRSLRVLAPLYGVSHAHIRSIRQGRCW
jgi:hypothetical protein